MGTFSTLHTATSGMAAARTALDVIAHNVANATTPGYKRQSVVLVEGNPPTGTQLNPDNAKFFPGTGVQIAGIRRVQTDYLDARINESRQVQAQWSSTRDYLRTIESQFNEPGDNGISGLMDRFWTGWQDVINKPDGLAPRDALISTAENLTDRVREVYQNIRDLQGEIDVQVVRHIDDINRLASTIVDLNEKIVSLEGSSYGPNDLLNRRDLLVEELAGIVNVSARGGSGHDFMLSVGGVTLVQGTSRREVIASMNAEGHIVPAWQDQGLGPLNVQSSQLRGLMDVRDLAIPQYLNHLDRVVGTMVEQVNALHRTGFGMTGATGVNFFKSTATAADFRVDEALAANHGLLAVSANGAQSNTEIAQAIFDLSERPLVDGENLNQSYRTLVASIGGHLATAERTASARQFTMEQLQRQREDVSGVSMDEEMADMVRFQQSFSASARVFQTVNYVLDTLLNELGK